MNVTYIHLMKRQEHKSRNAPSEKFYNIENYNTFYEKVVREPKRDESSKEVGG